MNRAVYRTLAAVVLAGIAAHRYAAVRTPADVGEYHRRVREAGGAVPAHIGGWVGSDTAVPAQAVRLLDPNLLVSRHYVNVEDGRSAGFLLVHCADAHDMAGHFPPRCYPAAGWTLRARRPREWTVGGLRVAGFEYDFSKDSLEEHRGITVASTLLRPGGQVFPDMAAMTRSILGAGGQSSGAGQLQVYFDDDRLSQDQRDAAVVALLGGYRPVIDAILGDVRPEPRAGR
jgi:hypothetical protein